MAFSVTEGTFKLGGEVNVPKGTKFHRIHPPHLLAPVPVLQHTIYKIQYTGYNTSTSVATVIQSRV